MRNTLYRVLFICTAKLACLCIFPLLLPTTVYFSTAYTVLHKSRSAFTKLVVFCKKKALFVSLSLQDIAFCAFVPRFLGHSVCARKDLCLWRLIKLHLDNNRRETHISIEISTLKLQKGILLTTFCKDSSDSLNSIPRRELESVNGTDDYYYACSNIDIPFLDIISNAAS